MSEWEEIRLRQLIQEIGDGGTPSTTDPTNFGNGIPWVVVDDIKPEIWTTKDQLTEKGFNSCSAKKWPVNAIILSTGATIGEVGIAKVEQCTKQGITGIIPNEFANNLFLRYWFEQNKVQLIRYAQGTTFKEIRPRTLGNLRIKIPRPFTNESILEQQKIAAILTKVDNAIQAVKNTIEKAERLKKALMQNLLTGKLKPDGTWRRDDEFYEDEKFGKVPVGWDIKTVDECFDFYPTASYSRSKLGDIGECLYIHYGDIHTKFHEFIDLEKVKLPYILKEMAEKYTKLKEGDLIISDASEDYSGVGKAVELVNVNGYEIISGLHTLHLRDKNNFFINGFRVYIFNHPKVRNLMLCSSTGIKVYSVSKNGLKKIKLPIPTEEEQKLIKQKLDSVNSSINFKKIKIQKLERLKKSLMQNLLTGKVRVKIDKPIEEKAE